MIFSGEYCKPDFDHILRMIHILNIENREPQLHYTNHGATFKVNKIIVKTIVGLHKKLCLQCSKINYNRITVETQYNILVEESKLLT